MIEKVIQKNQMQQVEPSQKYQVKINRQILYHHDSTSQLGPQNKSSYESNPQQVLISINKKDSKTQNKWFKCFFPQPLRRQLLRLLFIPLLIVLFLLTIALTFKQNNYQTNDYFYSKNIQINRKIRGVVPPLNETKSDIFGQYRIGLLQSFNVQDRRMLENFRVEMWRDQTMRVTEIGKEDKCWSVYKLKFYSSTIFIQKKQAHLMNVSVSANVSQSDMNQIKNVQDQTVKSTNQLTQNFTVNSSTTETNTTITNSSQTKVNKSNVITTQSTENSSQNQQLKTTQSSAQQKSICELQKWQKINQIFGNSHIWTFAQGNFYLMQFSQLQYDGNGVLIMKMFTQYPNNV